MPPKYKIAAYKVEIYPNQYMYDARIWRDGIIIQRTTGTLFNYKQDALDYMKSILKGDKTP